MLFEAERGSKGSFLECRPGEDELAENLQWLHGRGRCLLTLQLVDLQRSRMQQLTDLLTDTTSGLERLPATAALPLLAAVFWRLYGEFAA